MTKREKITLGITVVIVVYLGFNFLFAPLLRKSQFLDKDIRLTRAKIRKCLMLLSRKDAIRKKYAKFYSDDAGPPGSNPLSSELAELEAIANNAGVKILDMRTQITDEESLNKEFSVDLKLEGSVEGYVKFIYNVENSLLNLKIKTFALTIKSQDRNLEGSFSIAKFAATD